MKPDKKEITQTVTHIDELRARKEQKQKKVEQIKQKIDSGQYQVNTDKLSQIIHKEFFPEDTA